MRFIPPCNCRSGSKTEEWRISDSAIVWAGLTHWTQLCVPLWWARQWQGCHTHCCPTFPCNFTLIWVCQISLVYLVPTVQAVWDQWTLYYFHTHPTLGLLGFILRSSTLHCPQCSILKHVPALTVFTGLHQNKYTKLGLELVWGWVCLVAQNPQLHY